MISDVTNYIQSELSEKRLEHTLGVYNLTLELCALNGESSHDGSLAALLHDCTKEKSFSEQLKLIEKYNIILEYNPENMKECLHADTGAEIAKDIFKVNEKIYNAIKHHTIAGENMSVLDKIIYVADKCEKGRDLSMPIAAQWRSNAYKSLDNAMVMILADNIKYLEKRGKKPHKNTYAALNELLKEEVER